MEKSKTGLELISSYFEEITAAQATQLEALGPLYREWNEKINVISRKDIDALYERHVLHSLAIAAVFDFAPGTRILDLGCGGGFPGVPLAVFFPETEFLLVDSIQKKLKVVDAVATGAGIKNITTLHSRAEEVKSGPFDYVVSRAVAPLGELWKWSQHLIKKNSRPVTDVTQNHSLICLKGGDLAAEVAASGLRPAVWEISRLFKEEFFSEKYVLAVKR
jgi:16S rRNA (guanine527-N7)-methyltransferase